MNPDARRRRKSRYAPLVWALESRQLLSADVLTYHVDNSRTSANLAETILTPADVNPASFGKVGFFGVDGKVDAQPLYRSGVAIPGQGVHSVVYVTTEADSVYAFDAASGAVLWHAGPSTLLGPGETTVPASDYNSDQIAPTIGITATPVIDPATNAIYVVAMSKVVINGTPIYAQRLHALNLGTGLDEVAPVSIDATISYPGAGPGGNGSRVIFDPRQYSERDALTLDNGVIYTAWTSHADEAPYTGWVIGFRADNLALASVLDVNPNGAPRAANSVATSGGSFWNSGAGAAVDAAGNLYNISANGPFDPASGDYGDSYLKLSPANGLTVADYFAPSNQQALSDQDLDLGSSGVLLLPDMTDASGRVLHLLVGSGKDGNIYVLDRDNLGRFNASSNQIHQEVAGALGGSEFGSPAYFNGTLYFGGVGSTLRAFSIANGMVSTAPTSRSAGSFGYPGTSPTVSANGSTGGIVWAAENGSVGALHAYDAGNLGVELYSSNQAANGRDQFGAGNKFITPMVADGRVYVGTTNGVAVFGLLATSPPTSPPPPASPPVPPPPAPSRPPPPTVLVPAFSSSTFFVGGIDLLGAVGSNPAFGEAGTTYTWSVVATPAGAPTPAFGTNNGTTAARLVAVGIAAPGLYSFRVTITSIDGQAVTSDVTVAASTPVPTVAVRPFATASQVIGGTDTLAALGTDPAFPGSSLTYTWSVIGVPKGAPRPTIRPNGSNAAGQVTVSYARTGTYTFRVAIANPFAQVVTADVTVVVGAAPRRIVRKR